MYTFKIASFLQREVSFALKRREKGRGYLWLTVREGEGGGGGKG